MIEKTHHNANILKCACRTSSTNHNQIDILFNDYILEHRTNLNPWRLHWLPNIFQNILHDSL